MDSFSKTEETAADPFADDIFASGAAADERNEREAANLWSAGLPSARPAAVDWNKLLENLAADFSGQLTSDVANALARLLNLPESAPLEFVASVKREINEADDFTGGERDAFWLTVGVAGGDAEIYVEIDNAFAVSLVDAALGETNGDAQIRELTESEAAVVEFLSLNLTHKINLILQSPLLKFAALSREIPAALRQKIDEPHGLLLRCDWQIVYERLPAVAGLYFTPEALRALQPDENRLLDNRLRRAKLENLAEKIESVRMRLRCGAAELSLGELASLAGGDIILLENHDFAVGAASIYGRAEILLGDGENAILAGQIDGGDFAFGDAGGQENGETLVCGLKPNDDWRILIERLGAFENPASFEKSMTDTEENFTGAADDGDDSANQSNGLAIENLGVTLRVELEARRLTVAEIAGLRENQTLELGVRPTDAVNILVDNQTVGRGELVTVEGRLGVRILKLLR